MWGNNSCNQTANKNSSNNNDECNTAKYSIAKQDMDYTAEEVEEVDDDEQ